MEYAARKSAALKSKTEKYYVESETCRSSAFCVCIRKIIHYAGLATTFVLHTTENAIALCRICCNNEKLPLAMGGHRFSPRFSASIVPLAHYRTIDQRVGLYDFLIMSLPH